MGDKQTVIVAFGKKEGKKGGKKGAKKGGKKGKPGYYDDMYDDYGYGNITYYGKKGKAAYYDYGYYYGKKGSGYYYGGYSYDEYYTDLEKVSTDKIATVDTQVEAASRSGTSLESVTSTGEKCVCSESSLTVVKASP